MALLLGVRGSNPPSFPPSRCCRSPGGVWRGTAGHSCSLLSGCVLCGPRGRGHRPGPVPARRGHLLPRDMDSPAFPRRAASASPLPGERGVGLVFAACQKWRRREGPTTPGTHGRAGSTAESPPAPIGAQASGTATRGGSISAWDQLGPAPGEERGAVGMPRVPWTSLSLTLSASSLSALKAAEQT